MTGHPAPEPTRTATGSAALRIDTPVGSIRITERDGRIVQLAWSTRADDGDAPVLQEAACQLRAYFAGQLKAFDLPLEPLGSAFQRRACDAMLAIPFGCTVTYGELAQILDSAPQPVGNACGGNSIPIIIPCHRVLAASGLGGYSGAGGIETKIALLRHENAFPYLL